LILALREYADFLIVSVDDDMFYKQDWLELLYKTHISFPRDIISNHAIRISFSNKHVDGYNNWNHRKYGWKKDEINSSYFNFLLGYGGVLYPPHSLYKDVLNQDLFLNLSPHHDDLWFYVMALLNNTKIRKTEDNNINNVLNFDYILTDIYKNIPRLTDINDEENQNDVQIKAVLDYYGIYESFYEMLTEEKPIHIKE
jgi:hypothetical protein